MKNVTEECLKGGLVGFLICGFIMICIGLLNGCEDSQGEIESNRTFQCVDCKAEFSHYRHLEGHSCSFISKEDAWKLECLAADIKKYGINYPTEPNEVWGNGNPDPNHIKFFGNDNLSRLCYVQTQRINQQAQIINQLVALNSKQHKILGESDIELFNRVRKLEDPNEADK